MDDFYFDEERLEGLPEEEREYYEWVRDHGSDEDIEKAKEYFD